MDRKSAQVTLKILEDYFESAVQAALGDLMRDPQAEVLLLSLLLKESV